MPLCSQRRPLLLLFLLAVSATLVAGGLPAVQAQSDDSTDDSLLPQFKLGNKPLVVASLASLNRARDEVTYVFDAAGVPDAVDVVMEQLEESAGGLAGIDWDRPIGMMAYLESVFPPAFEVVAFMPVSTIEEFQRTMELGQVVMVNKPNEPGRYELIGPRQTIQIRVEQGYAFVQMPFFEPDPEFDRELPSPEVLSAALASQFDLAITLDADAVPRATKDLLLNILTSTMSAEMQQRDDEPDSIYEIRRSWMQGDIDGLKIVMDELNRVTLGLDVVAEERVANLDIVFEAPEGTKLLQEMFQATTKPSYFTPLLSEESPVSLSLSMVLSDRDRERYAGVFEGLKGELARQIEINDLGSAPEPSGPLNSGLTALQETFQQGHLDLFGQFYSDSDEKLAIVGGLRVEDGDAIAAGLQDLLQRVQNQDDIGEIQLGYNQHAGITFHRIVFKGSDPGREEVFGKNTALIFGVGSRSAWACVGGDEAFDTLKSVMDQLALAYENPVERLSPASFRLILNVNQLLALQQRAESAFTEAATAARETEEVEEELKAAATEKPSAAPNRSEQRREEFRARRERNRNLFRDTLAEGGDRIEIDFRVSESGGRTRIQFGEAYIRVVGRQVASRFGIDLPE